MDRAAPGRGPGGGSTSPCSTARRPKLSTFFMRNGWMADSTKATTGRGGDEPGRRLGLQAMTDASTHDCRKLRTTPCIAPKFLGQGTARRRTWPWRWGTDSGRRKQSGSRLSRASAMLAKADENSEPHILVLCCVLMGLQETIPVGTSQFHSRSDDYDSTADNMQNTRLYIVWNYRHEHKNPPTSSASSAQHATDARIIGSNLGDEEAFTGFS